MDPLINVETKKIKAALLPIKVEEEVSPVSKVQEHQAVGDAMRW